MLSKLKDFSNGRFNAFLPGQKGIIENVCSGINTLGVLPTGGGKSLCFQLPVYMGIKPAIVISPLIALMNDQVSKSKDFNYSADYINSTKDFAEKLETMERYIRGEIDILYVSPERLSDDLFVIGLKEFAKNMPKLIVVDEAHCISEWGHDFRLHYLVIPEFINNFKDVTILVLTATASQETREDICNLLKIDNNSIFHNFDTYKKNIEINVACLANNSAKDDRLNVLLESLPKPGLVYTNSRKRADEFAKKYKSIYRTGSYHSETKLRDKKKVVAEFKNKDIDVLFCTNAFGMGIDIPFIKFIIHYVMPSSLDQFIQEMGRAGRDGSVAYSYLFYSSKDNFTKKKQIVTNLPKINELQKSIKTSLTCVSKMKIKKVAKFHTDKAHLILVKQLITRGYYKFLGDAVSSLKIHEFEEIPDLEFVYNSDGKVRIFKSAKKNDMEERAFLQSLYRLYYADKISFGARGDLYVAYKILKDEIDNDDLDNIEKHVQKLDLFKNNKLQELIDFITNLTAEERIVKINNYFK